MESNVSLNGGYRSSRGPDEEIYTNLETSYRPSGIYRKLHSDPVVQSVMDRLSYIHSKDYNYNEPKASPDSDLGIIDACLRYAVALAKAESRKR